MRQCTATKTFRGFCQLSDYQVKMNSPSSSQENKISKSVWVGIEKLMKKLRKKKKTRSLVCGSQMRSHKKSDMVTSFPKMTRRAMFIEKNENFHSCEEYIRAVCSCSPPVVLV